MGNISVKLLVLFTALLLAGCRLEIIVPEGGQVTSASGNYNCDEASTCQADIVDGNFEETFTALPNAGYRFVGWSQTQSNVCEGVEGSCKLSLRALPISLRNRILSSSSVGRLVPIFEATDAPQEVIVSGGLNVLEVAVIDTDTNNPENFFASNNSIELAQALPNPGAAGGYMNLPGEGSEGQTLDLGDSDDFFEVKAEAGDVVTLFASDYVDSDLDLYLYDVDGAVVADSLGTGEIEELTIPETGTWYINASVFSGAANYVLTIGRGNGSSSSKPLAVPGEVW